jgi:hypothetical protein
MVFGTLTPDQLNFTIITTPSAQKEKPRSSVPLPKENQLTLPFRTDAYRDVRIQYRLNIQGLKVTQVNDDSYADSLQFVVAAYRDDGTLANVVGSTEQVRVSASQMQAALASGISFYQTIAVPVAGNPIPGNFFLRAAVTEKATARVGAIEIPAEWIKALSQSGQAEAHTVALTCYGGK